MDLVISYNYYKNYNKKLSSNKNEPYDNVDSNQLELINDTFYDYLINKLKYLINWCN